MTPLTNALKKMLNGLAAADAGEYLTPRQKTAFLENVDFNVVNAADPAPVLSEDAVVANTRRRVAMYMGSELPAAMMDYVIDTCASLDHDLTVLTFEGRNIADNLLAPYADALAEKGIAIDVAKLSGEPVPGLARYLRGRPDIAFMACKDTGYLGRSYLNGTRAGNTLPVPVVVVVTDPAAAPAQPAQQGIEEGKVGAA
jgi:hypothetical protein